MNNYRNDFPILKRSIHGKALVYLDSANSTQKPNAVIQAISQFYQEQYANIHRGVYELSQQATNAFEAVRQKVKHFVHADHQHEIIFTSGTTGAINLVAQSLGQSFQPGDEIILSVMEHHSNIVPWQLLQDQKGIKLRIIPCTDEGELDLKTYETLFSPRTKLVSVTHVSNVLGTINPIQQMARMAHAHQVPILVDGAQAVPHLPVDVKELECDFYAFSSHKMYGPTGVGILYGKTEWLNKMPPYQGGGDMIEQVTFEKTTYAPLPAKFEAGTPNIADVIGLGAAIDYLQAISMQKIAEHGSELLSYANEQLTHIDGLRILGQSKNKISVITFVLDTIHPHDIGTILDREGIAIRAGHHCAMPLMLRYHVPATVRASFGLYNNTQDIDALVKSMDQVKQLFA